MMMIAAGYEDCDDIDALRTDPALKLAVGRSPETGADLMSQPTLSRLENLAGWRALARIGLKQIDLYCRSFRQPLKRIVLDIDDTDDPVHGQQELALFNGHYDCTCFQPIHTFSTACRVSRSLAAAPWEAAIGRGGSESPAPCDPPHPQALAEGRNLGAWR